MVPEPVLDGRRVDSLVKELHRYAPNYTPELSLTDAQGAGPGMMRIFAHLAEAVLVRLGRAPHKHFVAFLDRLGISLLPARPARAPVTFRLASGLNEPVDVPAGARVTAKGPDDDIPFETTQAMVAVPGTIAAAYGVNPDTDEIYATPPGFLAQEIRTSSELVYEVRAFAAAGATRLQLDHVSELAPGSFLRICGNGKAVVLKKIDEGSIVVLEAPLGGSVEPGTIVTPIRDFEVFSGIDIQEHVLYLGHPDLFTVKEAAQITLAVSLAADSPGELTPASIAWEFWTTVEEDTPDAKDEWHALTVESDTTAALSSSGSVTLLKPDKLEIKEREVSGQASRWIRARLLDKLSAGGRALPAIDTITISVSAVVDKNVPVEKLGIAADQGFHNVTPLELNVDVGFLPFGTEPRQFDQFYIASEEAFSKRGAQVDLNIELDLQTLAAPALTTFTAPGDVHACAVGLRRSLYDLNTRTGDWVVLGTPAAETTIPERPLGSGFNPVEDSVPAVVSVAPDTLYVFVNTDDSLAAQNPPNRIWVLNRVLSGAGVWVDLNAPGPTPPRVSFSPAAVALTAPWTDFARVFVVAGDGKLYSRAITNAPAAVGSWTSHGAPVGVTLDSTPFVTFVNGEVLVFVNGGGIVRRLTLRSNLTSDWLSLTPDGAYFKAVSKPFAVLVGTAGDAKVFVFGSDIDPSSFKLFECDTRVTPFSWKDLGRPVDKVVVDKPETCAPSGFIEDPSASVNDERKHIFLRGADGHLYERLDSGWEDRARAGDPALRDFPATHTTTNLAGEPTFHVVSASAHNSLITWEFELRSGTYPATADEVAVRLDARGSDADDRYNGQSFEITNGAGDPETGNVVVSYDGALKMVRLTDPLETGAPDKDSTCRIGTEPVFIAADHQDHLVALHSRPTDTRRGRALQLHLGGAIAAIDVYSRLTGVVRSIDVPPAGPDTFSLYAEVVNTTNEYAPLEDRASLPELSWEYWNGSGWLSLPVFDGTRNLVSNGKTSFTVPAQIQKTEVAGQANFWIRARLVGGDYGRETFKVVGGIVVSEKSTLRPPKVSRFRIFYVGPPVPPATCLTFNNLDYLDQTAAALATGARFRPFERLDRFEPLGQRSLMLFLGFDRPFKTGPVRLFVDAAEREFDENRPPEFDWRFRKDRRWKTLDAEDGTVALTRQGILTLSASDELTREMRFGQSLFWIAGALRTDRGVAGADYPAPLLRSILLNTVWAMQGETIIGEILGSSDGEPNQLFKFQHPGVLDAEEIRVREVLSTEEQERIEREDGKDSIVFREDIGGTWVRWRETVALFDGGPEDRCYLIDRASGELRFGDGIHGRKPPAGVDNLRAFKYRTGGGAMGNVAPGQIEGLATAVTGIESVFNPTSAGGGSDKATTEAMLTIGPRRISHRDRAVSAEDFEELAQEASRQVAKVRCLVTTNLTRRGAGKPDPCDQAQRHEAVAAPGWVSLIVVPDSSDRRPCPSLELRRTVKDFLRQRAPSVLASSDRIVIRPPDYVEVSVEADIFVSSLELAAKAERLAGTTLETLLHPLRGGAEGQGWEFGRPIWKSDVFAALEAIDEIDRVEHLTFHFRGATDTERVVIGPNELLASGRHLLAIKKA